MDTSLFDQEVAVRTYVPVFLRRGVVIGFKRSNLHGGTTKLSEKKLEQILASPEARVRVQLSTQIALKETVARRKVELFHDYDERIKVDHKAYALKCPYCKQDMWYFFPPREHIDLYDRFHCVYDSCQMPAPLRFTMNYNPTTAKCICGCQ